MPGFTNTQAQRNFLKLLEEDRSNILDTLPGIQTISFTKFVLDRSTPHERSTPHAAEADPANTGPPILNNPPSTLAKLLVGPLSTVRNFLRSAKIASF